MCNNGLPHIKGPNFSAMEYCQFITPECVEVLVDHPGEPSTSSSALKYIPPKCIHGKRKQYCIECGGSALCKHKKRKSRCKECGGSAFCQHGREKATCKECGGSSVCNHGRQKSRCKDCGGSSICKHGLVNIYCKECGGSAYCRHGKFKILCKECGGSAFCKHGKIKTLCKECDGSALCIHDRPRSICKECGGGSICIHRLNRFGCKQCGGGAYCMHGRIKTICKDCGGSSICEHGQQRKQCRKCDGSAFCEHGKYKAGCKNCKGSSICDHNKRKSYCKICDGRYLCKSSKCETIGNPKYDGYCLTCFIHNPINQYDARAINYKTKEKSVAESVLLSFPDFTWVLDKRVQDGCSRRRPDLLVDFGPFILIIEVDENQHTEYDTTCEHKRLMEISQDCAIQTEDGLIHRPIVVIRFNPDAYTKPDGTRISSCWRLTPKRSIMAVMTTKLTEWAQRLDKLNQTIAFWIANPPEKTIEIVHLFYE